MKLFDLHCDTLFELNDKSQDLENSELAVSLKGKNMIKLCAALQFIPPTH